MMNIFKYELKMYRSSILVWSLSIAGLMILFMAFYPSFGADAELMEKMLSNYPEEFLKAFGMVGGLSISSVLGYFSFVFAFMQLCFAVQSANYGFSFLSVEERELTADFLMSKPVSRQSILISKFLAALVSLTITNIVFFGATFLSLALFDEGKGYDVSKVVLALLTVPVFQLFFMTVGMIISVSLRKIRSVLSFSLSLAFGMYILNAMRAIVGGDLLGLLSPYYHFEVGYIIEHGRYNYGMASISVGVIIVSAVASYILYMKRDIYSL